MIMKANKQIGFIYKDNESIDKILKDGDVVFERGFLREKTSTTLPITFGGVGKDLKDYKVYGNTKQQLLPDGYTQVDYIESNGTQYIDTGVYGNLNTEIIAKASSNGNSVQLFGDITTTNSAISCNFSFGGAVGSRFGNKNVSAILGNYITADVTFELIENKNGIYIDNNEAIIFNTTDNFTTTKTLILLNRNSSSGTTTNGWGGKLYYVKIYDNNMLVRDFIPCYRNSDNEVGLYDLVNNVFYTNQGTGVFTYGSVAPTPDTLIDMVSCGDRTKNLFDKTKITNNYYIDSNGDLIFHQSFAYSDYMEVEGNTVYSYSGSSGLESYVRKCAWYDSLKNLIRADSFGNSGQLTSPSNAKFFRTSVRIASTSGQAIDIDTYQIEENTTATSYEPYGYKIPVNVRSDNLFDKSNANIINAFLYNNKCSIREDYGDRTLILLAKPNTTYTVSRSVTTPTFRVAYTNNDLPTATSTRQDVNVEGQITDENASSITITTGNLVKYLLVCYGHTRDTNINESLASIQIVEGSTAPSKYIPYYNETTNIYLDEPLRKIDEYSDYIDFKNGRVVRNIDEIILNGSESWATAVTRNNYNKVARQFLLENAILNQGNSSNITKSTHFGIESANNIYSNSSIGVNCIGISDSGYLRIGLDLTVFPGDNSFKTWLSENNVTVDYVLETSTEEPITLPNIPTIDGNNTLNVETEITPSQVYIKYKSNE